MRARVVRAIFRKELLELLRNRRSLMVMLGVPLLLYPLLTIAVGTLATSKKDEMSRRPANVIVHHGAGAPELIALMQKKDSGIEIVSTARPDDIALQDGIADAVIQIPPHYQADVIAGKNVTLKIRVDRTRSFTPFAERKIDAVFRDFSEWVIDRRLIARNVPTQIAEPPRSETTNIATGGQTFGALLAMMLPMLLLLTGMLGALYPALSATTNERELGTLETLLVTPATRAELLTAKALLVLLSSLATALLNMVSMSLVLLRMLPELAQLPGGGVAIDPWALVLSFIAAAPTLIFFTALVLLVGLMSRNLREANAYATPVVIIPMASILIGIAEPRTTMALLVTPVANTTVIIRDVLTGHFSASSFVLAFVSSMIYAAIVLSLAGRIFTNEQLVNPAWEPLSLKLFTRRGKTPRRYPAIDEAITLFSVALLLEFYITPTFVSHGLLALVLVSEILCLGAPTAVFAWLGRYRWREVFSLRTPSIASLLGAALLGLGLMPVVNAILWLQQHLHILPYNESDMEGLSKLLMPALMAHPVLVPIVLGTLAGVFEELLFRGPIQVAFVRRLPIGLALAIVGLMFAAAHMDLPGLPVRFALGVLLGWVVWRSGSIFPAMLLHAIYDGSQVAWAAYLALHPGRFDFLSPTAAAVGSFWIALGVGSLMSVIGWLLISRSTRPIVIEQRRVASLARVAPVIS